jgi:hypothetical protein
MRVYALSRKKSTLKHQVNAVAESVIGCEFYFVASSGRKSVWTLVR